MSASRYCITQHPEVEARIAAELSSCGLLAAPGQLAPRAVAHDDLARLAYLNRVIKVGVRTLGVRQHACWSLHASSLSTLS